MKFIFSGKVDINGQYALGNKASNLYRAGRIGLAVPAWGVIPAEEFSLIIKGFEKEEPALIVDHINSFLIAPAFIEEITSHFNDEIFFAVRSSAVGEDGNDFSYAGQFASFLFVTKERLAETIKKVWCSAFSQRVTDYLFINNIEHKPQMAVIIQEMVNADVSGVAFGADPVTGDHSTKLVTAVYGSGEGLVSGELSADHFIIKNNTIEQHIADKQEKYVIDYAGGIRKIQVEEDKKKLASLDRVVIMEVTAMLDRCMREFGQPQDIEFAVKDQKLYLLQSRPVTGMKKKANSNGEYILWDNSNIIESYPGVTTPLTFSFISRSYEEAYMLFCGFMGVDQKVIKQHRQIFANTLGFINGRVYYNLKTWYHMLAMLPGYSINARFMEKMMGVKERFDIPETYQLSKRTAWWRIIKMALKMYIRMLALPAKKKAFMQLVDVTITKYKKINYAEKNLNELMQLYLEFEKELLDEWKAPLLNDFFAMIWFGLLQKRCEKYAISNNPNIHNNLLCGSNDIISIQPLHRSIELATYIAGNNELRTFFLAEDEQFTWKKLSANKDSIFIELKKKVDQYIEDYGERCIGELKLETISYRQDPSAFIKLLQSYITTGITFEKISGKIEEEIRVQAEETVNNALKNNFIKKYILKRTIRRTRELVSARENLRYERTRAFGIVRELFTHIGEKFHEAQLVKNSRDIFYLTREEIFSFIEGRSVTQDIKSLIVLRRRTFEEYQQQPSPPERFASYGPVYQGNDFSDNARTEKTEGDLKGIGCCPGKVRGKVRVVLDPKGITSLDGDILVTTSTDPGWIMLFANASGIIVERGSVLSHSAIVSREMGKPCIVGVTGLLKRIQTGDEIEMDGSTGQISIINSKYE